MNDAPAAPRRAPGKRISFALAVLMHVLLAVLIIYGIRWQTQKPATVEVELVRAAPPAPSIAPEPKPEPKPEPPPKPEPKPVPKPAPDPFKEQLEREFKDAEKRKAAAAAAQELASLKAQQASSAQASAMADYIARIRGKVRGNIVLPPDVRGNPEAVFEVTQLPSGEILNVRLKKTSGNPAWDGATERAILKSSPLPKPTQSELFNRTLELTFRPRED